MPPSIGERVLLVTSSSCPRTPTSSAPRTSLPSLVQEAEGKGGGAVSTGAGTIAVRQGRGWRFRLVIPLIALTVVVLTVAGVLSLTSEEPVADESPVVLPIYGGGPIYAGRWEAKPAEFGSIFAEVTVTQPGSDYERTLEATSHQRG
jgi:hypothetical protein